MNLLSRVLRLEDLADGSTESYTVHRYCRVDSFTELRIVTWEFEGGDDVFIGHMSL